MRTDKVQPHHIAEAICELHRSLIDIVSVINEPERDADMLQAAGLTLERALFPLLVFIERFGPIGVVQLAGRVGRDYTTVSRQVARLEALELITRQPGAADKRVRQAAITAAGRMATTAVDAARERMALRLFADWSAEDFDALRRLMRMFADGLRDTRPLRYSTPTSTQLKT